MPPLLIQVFSPSSRQWASPSHVAVVASAATSLPASASDSAKAARVRPARTPGSTWARSASLPNRVIGPVPRPCMANAKSASPECRARMSRARQTERTSSGPDSGTATRSSPAPPMAPARLAGWHLRRDGR
jgi:hypothetical protein